MPKRLRESSRRANRDILTLDVSRNHAAMLPYLPPLQALRAFEAAVRHMSYTRAAAELALTHGAVSRHIARLQDDLGGAQLFVRDGNQMLPTPTGQALAAEIRASLARIALSLDSARISEPLGDERTTLVVSVLPSLASYWLVPRLSRFQAENPGIDLVLRPSTALATLDERDGVDVAIRYGTGRWSGVESLQLMRSVVFPVCAPAYLARYSVSSPADLLSMRLLRSPLQPWAAWFRVAGIHAAEPESGPVFEDSGLLLQAALEGQGIALTRLALAAESLALGRLMRVTEVVADDVASWWLVWRDRAQTGTRAFALFRDWLLREVPTSEGLI